MAACRDCGRAITFETTANDRFRPVDADGTPHGATCPESPRNKRPAVPENVCASCGSDHVEREPGRGPHWGALRCLDCNAFRWLRKPEGATT